MRVWWNQLELVELMGLSEFVPKYSSTRHWFGRIFSATGMSVDPAKITAIVEAGRPM